MFGKLTWRSWSSLGRPNRHLFVPMWLPLLLVGVPTALLWWRDRRRFPPGYCQHCGYNLTGNVSGRCPECGTTISLDGEPTNANG